MTIWITSGNRPSNGARNLANQPGFRRAITGRGIQTGDCIVNWGASEIPFNTEPYTTWNGVGGVQNAANKLHFFQRVRDEVRVVPWTEDQGTALAWAADGDVVARTVLTGHSGNGIVIVPEGSTTLPAARLYTKYTKGAGEYRIHVAFGQVIDEQRKIRDPDREPSNWKVRSHSNGFIYARNGIVPSEDARLQSIQAILAVGLDFGAVDVIQKKDGTAYVLEINTAPGLEGQTIESYARAFRGASS